MLVVLPSVTRRYEGSQREISTTLDIRSGILQTYVKQFDKHVCIISIPNTKPSTSSLLTLSLENTRPLL